MLINNRAFDRVAEFLLPGHFANAVHGRIYAAIGKLIERGQIADPVALKHLFDQEAALAEIGGAQYLGRLAEAAVTVINAEHYGRQIHDLYLRRELITIGQDVVADAYQHDLDDPAAAQIERAEQKLFELAKSGRSDRGPVAYAVALDQAVATAEKTFKADGSITGIATGLIDLDHKLGGLQRSDLVLVAGRPGMGKTVLGTTIASAAARAGWSVLFVSVEMSAEQLAARGLAAATGISAERQRIGPLTREAFDELFDANVELRRLPLSIDESTRSIGHLRTLANRHRRRFGLDLVVVDYLQLMQSERMRIDNRVHEVAQISLGLKSLAKDLKIPVVALCQLNRSVENREDKRPHLVDLRDSGTLEQDADVVMFLYREEYYLERDPPQQRPGESADKFMASLGDWEERKRRAAGIADIIIAKNRHGGLHTVKAHVDGERSAFLNLVRGERE